MRKLATCLCFLLPALAEDWPEFRGKGRSGVWKETGIVDKFPDAGLTARWRVPVRAGFSGPAVAGGRVFVTDFAAADRFKGIERVMAIDERSGKILWTREWDADYRGMGYALGPRATPTVDGDRVYVVGATGKLFCLNAASGEILWQKDYAKDYGMQLPGWGITSSPLVDGERLIAIVGGRPDAKVMAFDKATGKEIWRSLPSEGEQGYSQPVIIEAGGRRQLMIWHPTALASLDPVTGKVYWEQPFKINMGMTLATPIQSGSRVLVSSFYNGSLLADAAAGQTLWRGKSDSEINTDGLHAVVNTPVIDGDYVYGICSYGQFRCLNLKTGERVWETLEVTKEKARWASGFIVRHGNRYFINNDRGELIIAEFSPKGYREISRTALIKPTSDPGNRRELKTVNWSHPAYANKHVIARNDEEIVSYSLSVK